MAKNVTVGTSLLNLNVNHDPSSKSKGKNVYKVTNSKGQSIHIEGVKDAGTDSTKNPAHIDVEDGDIKDLTTHLDTDGNGKLDASELQSATVAKVEGIKLIDNHAFRSQATKKYAASGVRFQWTAPKNFLGTSNTGTMDFTDDIVSVGTDNSGKILTFVCPRVTKSTPSVLGVSASFSGEVEIGEVAGSIDPVTGKGKIYLDQVNFIFWGGVKTKSIIGDKTYGISKRDAAKVPVYSSKGNGALIVLDNITPGAYAGQDASKAFSSYLVQAAIGAKIKQPLAQTLLKSAINDIAFPGLLDQGTSLQWNIDLKSGVTVNGL